MHDMPILHPLAAQGIRPHGKARPSPVRHGKSLDILPAAAALENALADTPHASPSVRAAIADVVSVYYARIAAYGEVRARGLAEPPAHDLVNEQSAYDQVWSVCGLDKQ